MKQTNISQLFKKMTSTAEEKRFTNNYKTGNLQSNVLDEQRLAGKDLELLKSRFQSSAVSFSYSHRQLGKSFSGW